jgi:NAD(P)-dependent dehydrogenase (short-subunit alcohol dehydrogenase family)
MKFNGECVLVTGTGSGIGNAAVEQFAAAGCRVIATVEKEAHLERVASIKGVAMARVLDVTREEDWSRVVGEAESELGGVDILFNNAGMTVWGDIQTTDRELWDLMINVNLTGQYLGCRAVIPGMIAKGKGAVVNMASINGIRGNNNLIGYSAAKGGIVAMTRSLALDHAEQGLRVNCVCPGTIDTPMVDSTKALYENEAEAMAMLNAKHPMGRLGQAGEVASVAVFLASDAASYMTGQAVPVDGGRSAK